MVNTNKECRGCGIKHIGCQLYYVKKAVEVCPCKNCLVKTVCNTICDKRRITYVSLVKAGLISGL